MACVLLYYRPFVLYAYGSAQGLAVAWCSVLIFDLIVVVMTLVKTVQINRRSGKEHTLTHVLMRDGKDIP